MFKQQRKAAGYVPSHQYGLLKVKLAQMDYEVHDGLKVRRDGEISAFRLTFEGKSGLRQNHVQVVDRGAVLAVYAHTEPHTQRLIDHAISAIDDDAAFSAGSRMLKNDLRSAGYHLMTFAEAHDSVRRRG